MNYNPQSAVWEITYACNMRCKHCGSGCGTKYPDELTTEEALNLCDSLGSLKLKILTLSGGEPFMRPDWPQLAKRLTANGVLVNAISNGWFINDSLVKSAKEAGIVNIGVSLDGLKETHDFIRMKGAYDHVLSALAAMNNNGMSKVVCTSINKKNIPELPEMKKLLYEHNVQRWQFQIASPMGNLLDYPQLICNPQDIDTVIDFTYDVMKEGRITIDLADDIGYFNIKENDIRKQSFSIDRPITMWKGCQAGKCVIGIRANGDISGCLSIRDDEYLQGNVREKPLTDIWNHKDAFSWNRNMSKDKLQGFCGKCQYAAYCLGGCTGLKLTFSGSIYDNRYCSFRIEMEKEAEKADMIKDQNELLVLAKQAISEESYQIAEIYLNRAYQLDKDNIEVIDLLGFVHYFLENYKQCQGFNVLSLSKNPENAYAHKGLGLTLAALGELEDGIRHLHKAIAFAKDDFTDPYFDLAVVLDQNHRTTEALEILDKGRAKSPKFKQMSEDFYNLIAGKAAIKN